MEGKTLSDFLDGKTEYALALFNFFIDELNRIERVNLRPGKTMIAIGTGRNFVYVTQVGKNFIHVIFPFNQAFEDNLCFSKIAQVPGTTQYNHHLRLHYKEDINDEVRCFIKMILLASQNE